MFGEADRACSPYRQTEVQQDWRSEHFALRKRVKANTGSGECEKPGLWPLD